MDTIKNINTIAELKQYRKSINEQLDAREGELVKLNKANKLSNEKFGYIKESFESLVSALYTEDKSAASKLMNKYIAEIKKSESLSNLHAIYESIRKSSEATDKEYLINSIFEHCIATTAKQLEVETKKVGNVLKECYLAMDNAEELLPTNYNKKLDEAVSYIASHKQSKNNIAEFANAVASIKESILMTDDKEEEEKETKCVEEMVDDFNEKYGDLEDEELDALTMENSEDSFNAVKKDCMAGVDAEMNESVAKEDKERMQAIHEQLASKTYNKDTFVEDVLKMKAVIGILKK